MSKEKFVIAYDLGTGGVKGALVTVNGDIAATATSDYPLLTPKKGFAEQSPKDYWDGVCKVTKAVMSSEIAKPCDILGVSFGSLWKGIIPVDVKGNVLRDSILWLDERAADQAKRLNARFDKARFGPSDYIPKLMWICENQPEILDDAVYIFEVNSYLKWKASGAAAVDISNCFTRSFDKDTDDFYAEVLEYAGIPRDKLPPIADSTDTVGYVTEKAAKELGIAPGIPVFGGNNDIKAVTVGAGCSEVNKVHAYLGSSGWVGYTVPHGKMRASSSFDRERDIILAGMRAVGLSLNRAAKNLYNEEYTKLGDKVFAFIDKEVEKIPAGSDGVLSAPWIYGDHPPYAGSDARGFFLNLGAAHDRRHMMRAVMESVCLNLKCRLQATCSAYDLEWPDEIKAVGGGACSDVWMQMLADVLGVPVKIPHYPRHAGALGTAYSALIGLGICSDYEEAARKLRIEKSFDPIPENRKMYEKIFSAYTEVYTALKPIIAKLNDAE